VTWNPIPNVPILIRDIAVNNAGYVLGVDRVGEIADADIEGMFATNGESLVLGISNRNSFLNDYIVLGLISMTQLLIKGNLRDLTLAILPISSFMPQILKQRKRGMSLTWAPLLGEKPMREAVSIPLPSMLSMHSRDP
jgi:hypothetical protein